MDHGENPSPGASRWRRVWPFSRRATLPARDERVWVHPSELPNFDRIPVFDGTAPRRTHRTPAVIVVGVAVLTLASLTLALRSSSPPATSALRDHVASSLDDLPAYSRAVASSAVQLVFTQEGHVETAAAMVIEPGNLAVTTEPIPPGASITGSSLFDHHIPVTLVTHDSALGFSVVRLGRSQPVPPVGVLPASSTVLAIAPVFSLGSDRPQIAYATTILGDPVVEQSDGIVSYLATASAPNLRGFADTLAIDGQGAVVAVMSANRQWYSAQYITKVARVITDNGGCHGRLGVVAQTAQGGGVVVEKVESGPAVGHLHRGDVLQYANQVRLDSLNTLLAYLYASPARQGVLFHVSRAGRTMSVGVVLGCQP